MHVAAGASPAVDTQASMNERIMFKRIVITGGNGFLGQTVTDMFRRREVETVSLSRREGVDLRDPAAVTHFLKDSKPDCVIHCAAHVGGIGYVREHAVEVFNDNLRMAMGLTEGLANAGVERLVTVMPNCTYPGTKQVFREDEWWDGPLHESVLMYGLPRKVLWGLCWTYAQKGHLKAAHLVLPNLYGPGDHFDALRSHALGALIARIVNAHRQGADTVEIWGTGRPIREWMFVEDAARAICDFTACASTSDDTLASDNPLFNVGIGEGISIKALAEEIRTAVGWKGALVFDRTRPDGATKKVLDGTRFSELTGWRPAVTLEAGIERTVEWYARNMVEA